MPQDAFLKLQKVIKYLGTGHDMFVPEIEEQLKKGSTLDRDTQKWLVSLVSEETQSNARSLSISRNASVTTTFDEEKSNLELPKVIKENENQFSSVVAKIDEWSFDVFEAVKLTSGRPLLFVGIALFRKYELFSKFGLNSGKVANFLTCIENGIHFVFYFSLC